MEATLDKLLKNAELTQCACAPGVVAEALERLAAGEAPARVLDDLARFDAVLLVRSAALGAAAGDARCVRALLLALPVADAAAAAFDAYLTLWRASLAVAALASALAARTGRVGTDIAWRAGLAHNLAAYLPGRAAEAAALAELSARWVAPLDPDGWVGDAVRHHAAPLARGKSAHPLVKVVQLAHALATREAALDGLDVRAALGALGIGAHEGAQLLADAQAMGEAQATRFALTADAARPAGAYGRLAHAYAGAAAASAVRDYLFAAETAESLSRALLASLRLLFGARIACVFEREPDGELRVTPRFDPPQTLTHLSVAADDGLSVLTRALRENRATRFAGGTDADAVIDHQIARCLGVEGFCCQPLMLGRARPALLVCDGAIDAAPALWAQFVAAWTDAEGRFASAAAAPPASDAIPRERVRRAIHEVANPLTVMRNYVNLLSARPGMDVSVQRDLAIIGDEIERVARIVRGITQAEAPVAAASAAEPASVNAVVSELVRMALGTLFAPNKVSVGIDLDPALPLLAIDKDALKQVLFNLAKNAVEAMPSGGHLRFATRRVDSGGQPCVEIEVADTGPGLPAAVRAHLFEPVESQKGGDHAGVGLAISRNLVARMGGRIDCETGPGGTRFLIHLPAPQASATAAVAQSGTP
jgi:hypothetical protein